MKNHTTTLLLASITLLVYPSLACDNLDLNPGGEEYFTGGSSEIPASAATEQGDGPDRVVASTNCDGLPRYVAGTPYSAGQHVFNIRNQDGQAVEYVCVIAGWCSLDSALYYEPGNGLAWDDAWDEVALCDGAGNPQDPVAEANGPYSALTGSDIAFSSAGSSDPDGSIVAYAWAFGDGTTSSAANPVHAYSAAGFYTVTLTVTDNDGNKNTDSTTATISEPGGPSPLPRRLLIGYWHNFRNEAGYLRIADVNGDWDIVNLAFAENNPFGRPGEMTFAPAEESEADFRAGVAALQARGQRVLISIGGANAYIQLNTLVERDNFVRTMIDIIASYGLDGMDIDLEGGSLNMLSGDTIANPRTPAIVNLISAVRSIKDRFGPGFILTMAPETAYVQGGYEYFGGTWGAYLPLIHALRDALTVLHVQHYNTGPITAPNDVTYQPATVNFHVALSDMMITGFPAGRNPNNFFVGLRADQVAFGLPASAGAAGSGQTATALVHRALDCLIKRQRCDTYRPEQAHPDFRGLMTWSITWDAASGFGFSTPHRAYLNQNL
ncbi:MAG: glycosyl hydrolase family 18 protein [Proteobacteria bacterium]|nr:glycosyl hydrolase family 18 protein [Pseudomonadota bacterium]